MKYYAIYTLNDELVAVLNNKEEYKKFFKKKTDNAFYNSISDIRIGKIKTVTVDGKHYKVYIMEDNEDNN